MKTKSINDLTSQIIKIRVAIQDRYLGNIADYTTVSGEELRQRTAALKVAITIVNDIYHRYVNNICRSAEAARINAGLHAEMKKYSRGYDSWYNYLSQQAQSNANNLQVPPSVYMHI